MRFTPFHLKDYFWRQEGVKYNLASSSMMGTKLADLEVSIDDFDLGDVWVDGNPDLVAMLARAYGAREENILLSVGGSEAIFLACGAFLRDGDRAVVECPSYPPLLNIPPGLGAEVVAADRTFKNGYGLDLDGLSERVTDRTGMVLLTNPHNPSGVVLGRKELEAVASMARDAGAYFVCDEIYMDAVRDAPPSVHTLGDHCVVISSLTKVYGLGGLRSGWLVAHPDVVDMLRNVRDYTTVVNSPISQMLSVKALEMRERLLARTRRILDENRPIVEEWLASRDDVEWVPPANVNISFPKYSKDIPSQRLGELLAGTYGVLVAPGAYYGGDFSNFRLTFGALGTERLVEGLEALGKGLDSIP